MIKPAPDALAEPFNEVWNWSNRYRATVAGCWPASSSCSSTHNRRSQRQTGKIKTARIPGGFLLVVFVSTVSV
jgi:hypothetical protein